MKEHEIEPRGKPPQNLRLTGRDGPSGLQMQIRGAPAWLDCQYQKIVTMDIRMVQPGAASLHERRDACPDS